MVAFRAPAAMVAMADAADSESRHGFPDSAAGLCGVGGSGAAGQPRRRYLVHAPAFSGLGSGRRRLVEREQVGTNQTGSGHQPGENMGRRIRGTGRRHRRLFRDGMVAGLGS